MSRTFFKKNQHNELNSYKNLIIKDTLIFLFPNLENSMAG